MGINERISEFCKWHMSENQMTQKEFGQMIDISTSQLSSIINGRDKVGLTIIEKFLNFNTDIDANWLLTGNGEMLKKGNLKGNLIDKNEEKTAVYKQQIGLGKVAESTTLYGKDSRLNDMSQHQISRYALKTDYFGTDRQEIPLYEIDAAAGLSTLFSSQVQQVPLDYISIPNAPACDGAVYVRGDSMYPILKSGDIACYKTINSLDNIYYGEMHLLDIDVEGDQYLTFKYVQKSKRGDDYVLLVSHNDHHGEKEILKANIRAIALVKLSIRYNTLA